MIGIEKSNLVARFTTPLIRITLVEVYQSI